MRDKDVVQISSVLWFCMIDYGVAPFLPMSFLHWRCLRGLSALVLLSEAVGQIGPSVS